MHWVRNRFSGSLNSVLILIQPEVESTEYLHEVGDQEGSKIKQVGKFNKNIHQ